MIESFHIIRPWWLLALVPLLVVLWGLLKRPASESAWRSICDAHLLAHLMVGTRARHRVSLILLTVGWTLATLALAGPTWSRLEQPVFQAQDARVIVMDLSLSMDATDIKPSRLARARFKALDILERSRDGQTGLIVFAHDAFALSPLTDDANTLGALVPVLSTSLMPGQGSELASALRMAEELLYRTKSHGGEVIVLADGVSRLDDAEAAAAALRQAGATVSVIGVGTSAGAPVPLASGGFLKDADGAIVVPKLDSSSLRTVAKAGGGRFSTVSADDKDLDNVLTRSPGELFEELEETMLTSDQWREDGIWIVLALLPLGALAFRRGWIIACLALMMHWPTPSRAFEWNDLWSRSDQQGAAAMARGDAASAATLFKNPAWAGTALYRAGQYDRAAETFVQFDDPHGHYNRGNALAKSGDLQSAIKAYDQALAMAPDHEDALFNKSLLEDLLQQVGEGGDNSQKRRGQSSNQSSQQTPEGDDGGGQAADQEDVDGENARREEEDEDYDQFGEQDDEEAYADQSADERARAKSASGSENSDESDSENRGEDDLSQQRRPEEGESANDAGKEMTAMSEETAQSLEQWLRRIPDDPGRLLRQKFLLEYHRRRYRGEDNESESPW